MIAEELNISNIENLMVITAVLSGIIHIYAGISFSFNLLILAGIGFLAGSILFTKKIFPKVVAAAAIPYTASQFYFYYSSYGFNIGPLAGADKIIQTVFIALTVLYLKKKFVRDK